MLSVFDLRRRSGLYSELIGQPRGAMEGQSEVPGKFATQVPSCVTYCSPTSVVTLALLTDQRQAKIPNRRRSALHGERDNPHGKAHISSRDRHHQSRR